MGAATLSVQLGGREGTLMCKKCFDDDQAYRRAAAARVEGAEGKRTRKPMEWLT